MMFVILSIDQQIYIQEKISQRYKMNFYNPRIAAMEVGLKLNKDDSPKNEEKKTKMVNIPYQNVDILMHA
jgi:hypothetical protein